MAQLISVKIKSAINILGDADLKRYSRFRPKTEQEDSPKQEWNFGTDIYTPISLNEINSTKK
jgi:hypothetical protein